MTGSWRERVDNTHIGREGCLHARKDSNAAVAGQMKIDQVAIDVYELEQHYKIGGQTEVPKRMPGKDYCFDEAQINSYEASVKPGGDMQKLYFLRCAAWPPGEPLISG